MWIGIGVGIGLIVILIICLVVWLCIRCNRTRPTPYTNRVYAEPNVVIVDDPYYDPYYGGGAVYVV